MFLCNSGLISTKEYLLMRHIKIVRKNTNEFASYLVWSKVVCKESCVESWLNLSQVISGEGWGATKIACPYIVLKPLGILGNSFEYTPFWVPYKVKNFLEIGLSWKYYVTIIVLLSDYTLGYSNLLSPIGWLTTCDVAALTVWSCSPFNLGKLTLV